MNFLHRGLLSLGTVAAMATIGSAQLFFENFDVDPTANWTVNNGPTDGHADFHFDYSTLGIPSAPGAGGTTRGLRMMANLTNGIFGGLSVSPTGQSFTGDYRLSAQVWMNFLGPAPTGGNGTTQVGGLGIGTNGTTAHWPGGNASAVYFMTTTDGNSSADWRAYSSAAPTSYADGSPVYFATTRNNSNPYYSDYFAGGTPPAAQTALYPSQTGTANNGTIAFGWHEMIVEKVGDTVTWSVSGLDIAQIDLTTVTLGGSNILITYSDTNATSSTSSNSFLTNMIVDNVKVDVVPEPASMAALALGVGVLLRRRKK